MKFKRTFTWLHKELPITEFLPFETQIPKMVAKSKWFIIAAERQIPTSKARHCYPTYKACLQGQVTEKQTRIQIYSSPATPQGSANISSLFIFCVELPSCLACTFCGYKAGALRHKSQDRKFQKKKKQKTSDSCYLWENRWLHFYLQQGTLYQYPFYTSHRHFPPHFHLSYCLCFLSAKMHHKELDVPGAGGAGQGHGLY